MKIPQIIGHITVITYKQLKSRFQYVDTSIYFCKLKAYPCFEVWNTEFHACTPYYHITFNQNIVLGSKIFHYCKNSKMLEGHYSQNSVFSSNNDLTISPFLKFGEWKFWWIICIFNNNIKLDEWNTRVISWLSGN